jgi:hypothetical protein
MSNWRRVKGRDFRKQPLHGKQTSKTPAEASQDFFVIKVMRAGTCIADLNGQDANGGKNFRRNDRHL